MGTIRSSLLADVARQKLGPESLRALFISFAAASVSLERLMIYCEQALQLWLLALASLLA